MVGCFIIWLYGYNVAWSHPSLYDNYLMTCLDSTRRLMEWFLTLALPRQDLSRLPGLLLSWLNSPRTCPILGDSDPNPNPVDFPLTHDGTQIGLGVQTCWAYPLLVEWTAAL